jgi:hypothetical protein
MTPRRSLTVEEWAAQVRDPAKKHAEGLRTVAAVGLKATATYDLAPLPCGRWAVRFTLVYNCGNFVGHSSPWTRVPTRTAGLARFLAEARKFFARPVAQVAQGRPRKEMLKLLGSGLFGFTEPEPLTNSRPSLPSDPSAA